jgi:hypothetical protein
MEGKIDDKGLKDAYKNKICPNKYGNLKFERYDPKSKMYKEKHDDFEEGMKIIKTVGFKSLEEVRKYLISVADLGEIEYTLK